MEPLVCPPPTDTAMSSSAQAEDQLCFKFPPFETIGAMMLPTMPNDNCFKCPDSIPTKIERKIASRFRKYISKVKIQKNNRRSRPEERSDVGVSQPNCPTRRRSAHAKSSTRVGVVSVVFAHQRWPQAFIITPSLCQKAPSALFPPPLGEG